MEWLPSWYGTWPGWALNERNFTWEVHDQRGQVFGSIACEVLAHVDPGDPLFQQAVNRKFGVPFPAG